MSGVTDELALRPIAWLDGDFSERLERNGSTPAWGERRKARGGAVPVYTRPQAAVGDPINADSDADYLRKLGDRIGGDCGAVLHGIAVGLDAPAPAAGDAVYRLIAGWRSYKGSIYIDNTIKQDTLDDCADELESALAQDRASQDGVASAPVGVEGFRTAVEKARRVWMDENPCEDGHDHLTPFDQFLYGALAQQPAAVDEAMVVRVAIAIYAAARGFSAAVAQEKWPNVEQKSRFTEPARVALEGGAS